MSNSAASSQAKMRKNQKAINIAAASILGVSAAMAIGGVASWSKAAVPFFKENTGPGEFTKRIMNTYAWKYMHITAAVLALIAIALSICGNSLNAAYNQ